MEIVSGQGRPGRRGANCSTPGPQQPQSPQVELRGAPNMTALWRCTVCTKMNEGDLDRCVTCARPRGHKPESDQLKRALDPNRKRETLAGYGDEDAASATLDSGGDDGGGFIGWGAMLSTVIAVVALLAAVFVAGTEEFQEFVAESGSITSWRCAAAAAAARFHIVVVVGSSRGGVVVSVVSHRLVIRSSILRIILRSLVVV